MIKRLLSLSVVAALAGITSAANADLIDFETIPGDTNAAGLAILDQYQTTKGVRFRGAGGLPGGLPTYMGLRGGTWEFNDIPGAWGDLEGWQYPNTIIPDGPEGADEFVGNEGINAGDWFITDVVGADNGGQATLNVYYDAAVAAFSFDIYDVDNTESYTISWYDSWTQDGTTLIGSASVSTATPDTGDGHSTRFGRDLFSNQVLSLRIVGIADPQGSYFGLGFDNFNTAENVPVPAPLALMALGLVGIGAARRRKAA